MSKTMSFIDERQLKELRRRNPDRWDDEAVEFYEFAERYGRPR